MSGRREGKEDTPVLLLYHLELTPKSFELKRGSVEVLIGNS
jgi:hypothetical protein